MKTLVKDGISIYLFSNDEVVTMSDTSITVGEPPRFMIADCSSEDTTLYTGVDSPADWFGHKYLFDGVDWTANPDWTDPYAPAEPADV